MISTYRPAVSVKLVKVVSRRNGVSERYSAMDREIDLTPFLGEFGGIHTHKSVRDAFGTFSVTLTDQKATAEDTLYAAIEPMDYIEIRAAREAWKYSNRSLPIIMRGFVKKVRRSRSIGANGKPSRSVIVDGADYGIIPNLYQIWYDHYYNFGTEALTYFKLFSKYGTDYESLPAGKFIDELTKKVLNPAVERMSIPSPLPQGFTVESTVSEGTVAPYGIQPHEGSLWALFETYCDRPWNELFVDDRDEDVRLVYRPTPFKGADSQWIGGATDPGTIDISSAEIISNDLFRWDGRIANFFWSFNTRTSMNSRELIQLDAMQNAGEPYFLQDSAKYPNSNPNLYGLRKMQHNTEQGDSRDTSQGRFLPETEQDRSDGYAAAWCTRRRNVLIETNKDNVVFEEGSFALKGSEAIRAGQYLRLTDERNAEYYMHSVDQSIAPFSAWKTSVEVERGTGFTQRARSAKSPYERFTGVYG